MLLYQVHAEYRSYSKCRKFRRKFTDAPAPNPTTIYKYVKTFRARGSILCRKKAEDMLMLTEEKLGGFGARLEIFARKSLVRLAQKTGVSAISANCSKTAALAVHPCKTLQFTNSYDTGREARLNFFFSNRGRTRNKSH